MGKFTTNINVGEGKSERQLQYDDYIAQLVKNKKQDRSRRGLEDASGLFKDETAGDRELNQTYEDVGFDPSALVAQQERDPSDAEQSAKMVAGATDSNDVAKDSKLVERANAKAAKMPYREGYNTESSVYNGPGNEHFSDMERVNNGLAPNRGDEFRANIDQDPSLISAAAMLPTDPNLTYDMGVAKNQGIVATHEMLSNFVSEQFSFMNTGFGSTAANIMIDNVANDTKQDPKTVAEWFNTVLTDHKTLKDNGVPQAFSDAALTAVLQVMKKNRWAQVNREAKIAAGDLSANDSESETNTSMAHDEEIGGLIETAFGKKDSTAQTRAISGAIARRVVTDALGGYELNGKTHGLTLDKSAHEGFRSEAGMTIYDKNSGRAREVTPEGYVKAGLFHSKKMKLADGKTLWVTELTNVGLSRATELEGLANIILPGLRKDVNANPPMTEEGFTKTSSKAIQRKQDPKRLSGEARDLNKGKHALENAANATDTVMSKMLLATLDNKEAVDMFMKEGEFVNLIGLELPDGRVIRQDANGNAFAQEYRLDKAGNKIPNPRYNPNNPENELEFETKTLMGDKAKMANFQQDIQWLQDHMDDTAFYYTYTIGGAKRLHVAQTVGNYQNSKLVRSLLQSAVKAQYNLDNKLDMILLKAGILKKLGFNKAIEGSNFQLAEKFDRDVMGWTVIQTEFEKQGGTGFAPALIKEAAGHEGWMSLSAISEALAFNNHIRDAKQGKAGNEYFTGFLTEIDGLANGLAINSMQAGDLRVAGLTGMIPLNGMIDKETGEEYSLGSNDVYTITSEMFRQQVNNYSGKDVTAKFQETWNKIFEEMFNDHDSSRGLAKTALMIFGYGAGDTTISSNFQGYLAEKLDGHPIMRDMLQEKGKAQVEKFLAISGKMMVKSVQTNFPEMRELAKVLSSITGYAASLGIEPHTITADYDWIEFGLSQRIADDNSRMKGSYKAGAKPKGRPGAVEVQTMVRFLDAMGVETKGDSGQTIKTKFNVGTNKLHNLKASKQAPVLITQSIDSLVMMRAIANLRANAQSKNGFFAAQVYDGMLMTPKDAQGSSDALHREIMRISRDYSSVDKLIESITDLDAERFYEIARLNYKAKIGRELTEAEEAKVKENPMKFILDQVPWKNEYGKKVENISSAISRISKRRAEAVKKMDLAKMYQYAWNWPTKK